MQGKWLSGLRYLLSGDRTKAVTTLPQRRDDYIKDLEKTAVAREEGNKVLEEQLEFKKRASDVATRIRRAEIRRESLWRQLGDYGVRRPKLLKWVMICGGVVVLFLLFRSC